jgi:hypothetical protein
MIETICLQQNDIEIRTGKPSGGQANINADELGSVSINYFEPNIQC